MPTVLDAGPVLNVTGPNGVKQMPKPQGTWSTVSPTPLYLAPGNYTIDNGNGGADVGPFKLNITVPPAFTWTNESSITSVDRSQPLLITWTGGDPSFADTSAFIAFTCWAKDSDLQLTVPAAILSVLPASTTTGGGIGGNLTVATGTSVNGTAPDLDGLVGSDGYSFPKTGIPYK